MPPMQQAREILALLRLEGSKFSVEADLLQRLEQTWGLKVTVATRKVSARPGFSGAAIQVGDALIIVCPEEGGEALRGPIIAHEVAHIAQGDPGMDMEAITKALNACPDRRLLRWEIGLRYRPPSAQLALPLPVEQDLASLPELSPWERMEGEYRTLTLYPNGHLMAHLRPSLPGGAITSQQVQSLEDGAEVAVAGLVIRRQRPETASGVIFLTLEDEFGHIPCVVWPQVYRRYRAVIKEPVLLARGAVSRRDGTLNVVVRQVEAVRAVGQPPKSRDWG